MKPFKKIGLIGVGHIGGSMVIDLREAVEGLWVIGVDTQPTSLEKALASGLLDEVGSWEEAMATCEVIVLAVPVDVACILLPQMLEKAEHQVILDVGSTKAHLAKAVVQHAKRGRYVATHPMAGTEYSGIDAAVSNLFEGRTCVLCDVEKSDADAVEKVQALYKILGMPLTYMDSEEHDVHAAYVSHISHISSFGLALTVLDKEQDTKRIFELASGGFRSTVRLAKSNADMWSPIFIQNKGAVLDVLRAYMVQLQAFQIAIENDDHLTLKSMMDTANQIGPIVDK